MKKRYSRTLLIATAALAATSSQALANPNGGTVVAGQATIAQTAPTQVTITQSTDKAIINWNSFSIGAGEKTRFVQPSSNSITLNRVTGPDVSQILGQLTANGRVVLVNPNGVFFGKDSQVDVAALVATSHDIKNDDFMAGNLNFTIPGKPGAQIINQGKITVQEGGLVALVAPAVQNSGLITARLGKVALASANSMTIDLYGDNLILFAADSTITEQLKDALGNPLSAAVENSGAIEANGGWVLLTAEVAKNVVDKAINMTGHIKAASVDQRGGTIFLHGGQGDIEVSGTMDVSGTAADTGGEIRVTTDGTVRVADTAHLLLNGGPDGGDGGFLAVAGADGVQMSNASYSLLPQQSGGDWLPGWLYVGDNVEAARTMANPNRTGMGQPENESPVVFEPNVGQFDDSVAFVANRGDASLFLTAAEAVLAMRTSEESSGAVFWGLEGGSMSSGIAGEDLLQSYSNYYLGNDPTRWKTLVPNFGKVRYQNVYDGIDLVYYTNRNKELEYDLVVNPGADPNKIVLDFSKADSVMRDASGNLLVSAGGATVVQRAPLIYQKTDGARVIVPAQYQLDSIQKKASVSLQGTYDRENTLVIDPTLSYSTYLTTTLNGYAEPQDIKVGNDGMAYVAALAYNFAFPTASGMVSSPNGMYSKAVLLKINPNASGNSSLVYAAYFGGNDEDFANGVAVDGNYVYLSGNTQSPDFPTRNGYSFGGDSFLLKLNSAGTQILYGTTVGNGGGELRDSRIAVDSNQNVYWATNIRGGSEVRGGFNTATSIFELHPYLLKIDTKLTGNASLKYSTYFGTNGIFAGVSDIAIDSYGYAYVTGGAYSAGLPLKNAYQNVYNGNADAFLAKIDMSKTGNASLLYSTYVGGVNTDYAHGVAVDGQQNAYMTGYAGFGFPVKNAYLSTGNMTTFVTRIDTTKSGPESLMYSTVLAGWNIGHKIAVDADKRAYVTGGAFDNFLPVTFDALQNNLSGSGDAFLTAIDTTKSGNSSLLYSSYHGGLDKDEGHAIAVDRNGSVFLAGYSGWAPQVGGFPTTQTAFYRTYQAWGYPGFFSKINLSLRYQTAPPDQLLTAINGGLFRNDPADPIWNGLYVDGRATAAQIEANRLFQLQIAESAAAEAAANEAAMISQKALYEAEKQGQVSTPPVVSDYTPTSPIDNMTEAIRAKFIIDTYFDGVGAPNISELSFLEKKLLARDLRELGISAEYVGFGVIGEQMRQDAKVFQDAWSHQLDNSIKKMTDAGGLSSTDIAELTVHTAINTTTGIMDALTLSAGAEIRLVQKAPVILNVLKSIEKSKSVGATKKFLSIMDEPVTQVALLLAQNGFTVTNELRGLIASDKSVQDQLKAIGVTAMDLAVGNLMSKKNELITLLVSKTAQATVAVSTDVLSEILRGNPSPEIVTLAETASEFIPYFGAFIAQAHKTQEIVNRTNPEERAAIQEFFELQRQYRISTDAYYERTLTTRLQIIADTTRNFY